MNARMLTTAVAAALLAGCNFAPHYREPAAAPPAAFKEATPNDGAGTEGWKLAQPSDQLARGDWWDIYDDPDLSALEGRVAKANQNVVQAEATYREAWAVYREAVAQLFPTVGVNPEVVRSRSPSALAETGGGATAGEANSTGSAGTGTTGTGGTGGGTGAAAVAGPGTHTLFELPFEASYEVDLWGQVRNTIRENRALAQSSAATLANEILSMQAQLAQDYFNLRAVDEERFILDTTMEDYRASLRLTQTLYRTGIDSAEDVSQATTQLETADRRAPGAIQPGGEALQADDSGGAGGRAFRPAGAAARRGGRGTAGGGGQRGHRGRAGGLLSAAHAQRERRLRIARRVAASRLVQPLLVGRRRRRADPL
jgi:outer membrane protein TolC